MPTGWKPMFGAVFAADPRHRDDADALAELLLALYHGFAVQTVTQTDETRLQPAYEHFIELLQRRPSVVAPPAPVKEPPAGSRPDLARFELGPARRSRRTRPTRFPVTGAGLPDHVIKVDAISGGTAAARG